MRRLAVVPLGWLWCLATIAWTGTAQQCPDAGPSWESEWLTLQSQAGADSFMELSHDLNELPVKGKVLVRPLTGPNAGLTFEGIGSQQKDDEWPVPYCGVVFFYNSTHFRVGAPTEYNNEDTGRIFCAGQEGWTDANGNAQSEQEAEVKVVLWLAEMFPPPDVEVNWTPVDCLDPNAVFYEFPNPIGEALSWVQLQVRVQDEFGQTWVSEGIGSDNFQKTTYGQHGGIIYSHSDTAIRVWVRYTTLTSKNAWSVACAWDGWGYTMAGADIAAKTGEVRILGWKSLGDPLVTASIDVDLDGDVSQLQAEIPLGVANTVGLLISLQVTPVDGDNAGFTFYGTGSMPTAQYKTYPFGGVHFGYSDDLVRLFYPVGAAGCLMNIGSTYGGGMFQQCARRATVTVSVWDVYRCGDIDCENGGTPELVGDTWQCSCIGGFTGPRCEEYPETPMMMNVTCDNIIQTLILDGVEQAAPDANVNQWQMASTYSIPAGTQVVGVKCENTNGIAGLLASFDNGQVTDASWECSVESFDSGMAPASVYEANGDAIPGIFSSAYWIWTGDNSYSGGAGDVTVFCKGTLNW